jgi:hypothetical protein
MICESSKAKQHFSFHFKSRNLHESLASKQEDALHFTFHFRAIFELRNGTRKSFYKSLQKGMQIDPLSSS